MNFRSLRLAVVLAALSLSTASLAQQRIILPPHRLVTVQYGPGGELLLSGSMGAILSRNGGEHWGKPTPPAELIETESLDWARRVEWRLGEEGDEWHVPGTPPGKDVGGRLYRCSADRRHVDISDDAGRTWQATERFDKRGATSEFVVPGAPLLALDLNGMPTLPKPTPEGERPYPFRDRCEEVVVIEDTPYLIANEGIYWSADRGRHWLGKRQPLPCSNWARDHLADSLFGDGKGTLYSNCNGIHASRDRGANWQELFADIGKKEFPFGRTITLLRVREGRLYFVVGSIRSRDLSLYRSEAGAAPVKLLSLKEAYFYSVNFHEGGSGQSPYYFDIGPRGELAVVTEEHLYLSRDDGGSWQTLEKEQLMTGSWERDLELRLTTDLVGDGLGTVGKHTIQVGPKGELLLSDTSDFDDEDHLGAVVSFDFGMSWMGARYSGDGDATTRLARTHKLGWARGAFSKPAVTDSKGYRYSCGALSQNVRIDDGQSTREQALQPPDCVNCGESSCLAVVMEDDVPHVFSERWVFSSKDQGRSWQAQAAPAQPAAGSGPDLYWGQHCSIPMPRGFSRGRLYGVCPSPIREGYQQLMSSGDHGVNWRQAGLQDNAAGCGKSCGRIRELLAVRGSSLYFIGDAPGGSALYRGSDGKAPVRLLDLPGPYTEIRDEFLRGPPEDRFSIGLHGEMALLYGAYLHVSLDNGQAWRRIRFQDAFQDAQVRW